MVAEDQSTYCLIYPSGAQSREHCFHVIVNMLFVLLLSEAKVSRLGGYLHQEGNEIVSVCLYINRIIKKSYELIFVTLRAIGYHANDVNDYPVPTIQHSTHVRTA